MNPYISVFTIFLALLLSYHNWNINRNSIFLSGFIIVFAIYALIHYFLLIGNSVFWLAVFYNNTAPICYLAGPLLYFYVKGTLLDRYKPKKKDWFHLIPAVINLISVTPYLLTSFDYKLNLAQKLLHDTMVAKTITVGLYPNIINAIARPLLLCVYCTTCIVFIYQFSFKTNNKYHIPKKQSRLVLRWLLFFIGIIALVVIFFTYLSYLFWRETNPDVIKLITSRSMYLIQLGFLLIPVSLLIYPEILYGIPRTKKTSEIADTKSDIKIINNVLKESKKQEGIFEEDTATLTDNSLEIDVEPRFVELSESILTHIKESKIYLSPNFSMEELSRSMNVPKHHLYYCFNSILKIKLTKIRAELRIEYAKELIKEGHLDFLTLETIGNKAGFSSRSSFQSTFKEEVGCTPGEYLKSIE